MASAGRAAKAVETNDVWTAETKQSTEAPSTRLSARKPTGWEKKGQRRARSQKSADNKIGHRMKGALV